ncbi:Membrane protein involved in the export of O-antigen and teichoic acid [Desulfacinum infernum DSM 9756]|uniref:Membrane protein involved in the export of O-antigen and teichoic acid n=1 Tax=Desulfacinum infernum DSM 9756 TaxID=1121391 RepID=A0A1M5CTG9_9BACT|nr:oligosaccharide flippase family protein [Desulfacinum infernum]SHF57642.1 Membrane protein involved in the export of O-antigen and teichoic acid [Desulfacinum infernum DSM 9756]
MEGGNSSRFSLASLAIHIRLAISLMLDYRPGRLFKGTLAMTAGMTARIFGQAVVFLLVARTLGVGAYGAYAAVLALAMTIGNFNGLGVSVVMLKDTARDATVFQECWGRALAAWLLTSPILLVLYGALAVSVLPERIEGSVVLFVGLAEIVVAPFVLLTLRAFQGHGCIGRAARLAFAPIMPRLLAAGMLLLSAFYISKPSRLVLWAILYLLAAVASAIYSLRLTCRDLKIGLEPKWDGLMHNISEGWAFSLGGASDKLYADLDKIMLSKMSTLETAGAYAGAYRVIDMVHVPVFAFFSAVAPRFFDFGKEGMRSVFIYALKVMPVPMLYVLVSCVVLFASASLLPVFLGPDFSAAVDVIRWLVWLPLLSVPRRFGQMTLSSSGWQRRSLAVLVFGAVLNLMANLWAIPLWGWRGAVAATYIAEMAMGVLVWVMFIFSDGTIRHPANKA